MRLLITAGPTREPIDSVRFLSNASSGKLGFAIAKEAVRRGHDVDLVAGPVPLEDPPGAKVRRVVTAEEMLRACETLFDGCRAAVMVAAVSDYRPAQRSPQKIKKLNEAMHIEVEPTPDICATLGASKGDKVVVGFAMEDHDHRASAELKMDRKHCDAIVLNDVANAGGDEGRIEICRQGGGWEAPVSGTKAHLAVAVVDLVESLAGG